MQNKIRKPKQGYETDTKQEYRNKVWDTISEHFNGQDMSQLNCLLLPSYHGLEIEKALSCGIAEKNIYACDDNAAMLATAKWRKQFPKVNILGTSLSRSIERLKQQRIIIDIANLDLCTNLSQSLFNDVSKLIKSLLNAQMILCVTVLKGREFSSEATLAKMLWKNVNNNINRIGIIYKYILASYEVSGKILLDAEYRSNTQYMCHGIYHIINNQYIYQQYDEIFNKYDTMLNEAIALDDIFHDKLRELNRFGYGKESYDNYYKKAKIALDNFWNMRNKVLNNIEEETLQLLVNYDFEHRICYFPKNRAWRDLENHAYHRI